MGYEEAYQLQRSIHAQRLVDEIEDRMLLLEHPPVFTIPRRSKPENLLVGQDFVKTQGAATHSTDRGGEITFHDPGQLVGYPICRLEARGRDLHSHLRWMESRLAEVAERFGVPGTTRKGFAGLWVENRKIASIGIAVKRWTTLHGFALNVNNDLSPFRWIRPCGLTGIEMTSLAKEAGHAISWRLLLEETCNAFGGEWKE